MEVQTIDMRRLDPDNFVDLDLSGEEIGAGALSGLCASWAQTPPFYVLNAGVPQVVVGRYADCKAVYLDREHFTTTPPRAPGYERFDFFNGLITVAQTDGADHDRIRRLMNPSFAPAALTQIGDRISAIITTMLDEVEARGGAFDCMSDFASHLVVRILLDGLLGLTPDQQTAFVSMHDVISSITDLAPGEKPPAVYIEAQLGLLKVMDDAIRERQASPREHDFISTLVTARDETDKLSHEELIANIFGILAGGLGTTGAATGALLLNLCKHRDQFNQVIADPSLIPQTIEESLRYQGAIIFAFPRFATDDVEVGTTLILKGMPVLVCPQAGNLDPNQFPDPLSFNVHRAPKNTLAFGTGSHHCLGNRLVRRVMAEVLEQICVRFPNLRLQDADFTPRYTGALGEVLAATSIPMHTGR